MLRLAAIATLLLALVSLALNFLGNQPRLAVKPALAQSGSADLPLQEARAILAKKPLYAGAYYVQALDDERRGDDRAAAQLVDQAVRINPRFWQARLWRAQHALAGGRPAPAVNDIAVLFQIRPKSGGALARLLAQGSRDRALRRLIAARFANQPALLDILRSASDAGLSAGELSEIVARTDVATLPGGVKAAQVAATAGLLHDNRYDEAYAIWRALLPSRPTGAIHDPGFTLDDAAPPFGWTLTSASDVEVGIVPSGLRDQPRALQVRQFGSLPSVAAEQSLILAPGDYLLRFRVRTAGATSDTAAFFWAIRCASGKLIAEEPIRAGGQWTEQRWHFSIAADCPMEVIELRSEGTEQGGSPTLRVTGLQLQRVAAP